LKWVKGYEQEKKDNCDGFDPDTDMRGDIYVYSKG
jgi:hypothetical protein